MKNKGFTLAEILITLAIIGVVAAMTIPTLIAKINDIVKTNQIEVIEKRFEQGISLYSTMDGAFSGKVYENTEEFVNGLSKYFKMIKICGAGNLGDCFPYVGINYEKADGTMGVKQINSFNNASLHLNSDKYYAPAGFISAGGVPYIIALKKDCIVDPDSIDKTQENPMACIAGIYDYNGARKSNTEGEDIISINGARISPCVSRFGGLCLVSSGAVSHRGVNCNNYPGISEKGCAYNPDMWAGAKVACQELGGRLPNDSDMETLTNSIYANGAVGFNNFYKLMAELGLSRRGDYHDPYFDLWTDEEVNNFVSYMWRFSMRGSSKINGMHRHTRNDTVQVFCVGTD